MFLNSLIKSREKKFSRPIKDRNIQKEKGNSIINKSTEGLVHCLYMHIFAPLLPVTRDLLKGVLQPLASSKEGKKQLPCNH